MATPTDPDPTPIVDEFHDNLLALMDEFLDAYYDAYPNSSAFGADCRTRPEERDASVFVGRGDGADGSDHESGVDYIYRKYRDVETGGQETDYVWGSYGWMDPNELIEVLPFIRDGLTEAVERDIVDEAFVERFDSVVDGFETELQELRFSVTLDTLERLLEANAHDCLRVLLGHGDEERRTIWQLLQSKAPDDGTVDNDVDVLVKSEPDRFLFARTERLYHDEQTGETKEYAYGAIVGYDDTPERFFVHRIESDPDLRDPETDWTPDLVKEKMGFDRNVWEVDLEDMPTGERVRLQGDLAVVRHSFERGKEAMIANEMDNKKRSLMREHIHGFVEAHPEVDSCDNLRVGVGKFSILSDDTDAIKAIQETCGIAEETVREEQEDRDWTRLTANRRADIVTDLLHEQVVDYALAQTGGTREALRSESRETVKNTLEPDEQVEDLIGNHVVMGKSVSRLLSSPFDDGGDAQMLLAVTPDATMPMIGAYHHEHEPQHFVAGSGFYELRFLEGFEDQWWQ